MYQASDCLVWNNLTLWPQVPALCHLKAGIYPSEIFRFTNDSNLYICSGQCELFHIITRYLRCSITFVESEANFGGHKVNGTWLGILALFAQKKADFIPHLFTYSEPRSEIVYYDFLMPHEELVAILSHPKRQQSNNPLRILDTFPAAIWAFMLLAFLVCSALHIVNVECRGWRRPLAEYIDMFGLTLGQSKVLQGRLGCIIDLIYVYILAMFILRQLFSGDMTAILLSADVFKYNHFKQLATDNVHLLKHPHLAKKIVHLSYVEMISIDSLIKLVNSNYVMIIDINYAHRVMAAYPQIRWHISKEAFGSTLFNYPLRKTLESRTKKLLSRLFRHVHYFGLVKKVFKKLEANQLGLDHKQHPTMSLEQLVQFRRQQSVGQMLQESHHHGHSTNILTALYIYFFGLFLSSLCFEWCQHLTCVVWNNLTLWPQVPALCHLNVDIYSSKIFRFANDSNVHICSGQCELIHIITRYLCCSITFIDSEANFGGRKINETWLGILALFAQKRIDFIPHMFTYSQQRSEIVYYDFLMPREELLSIISHPKRKQTNNPLRIFHTFPAAMFKFTLTYLRNLCYKNQNETAPTKIIFWSSGEWN